MVVRMTDSNLAIVFGPNLIWAPNQAASLQCRLLGRCCPWRQVGTGTISCSPSNPCPYLLTSPLPLSQTLSLSLLSPSCEPSVAGAYCSFFLPLPFFSISCDSHGQGQYVHAISFRAASDTAVNPSMNNIFTCVSTAHVAAAPRAAPVRQGLALAPWVARPHRPATVPQGCAPS